MPANLEYSAVATGWEKVSFHSNPKERQCQRMLKLLHIALIPHTSKVIQARLKQYMNCELPDVQVGFRKGGETIALTRRIFVGKVMSLLFNMLSRYHTIALISHPCKVMLKILQAGLQQYVNCELPDVQAGFRKGRGTRDLIANIHWIM